MVECKTCHRRFPSCYKETDEIQAYGCAAAVTTESIVGYYGSSYDLQQWDFVKRPPYVSDGIICDQCIEVLMKDKEIVFVKDLIP